MSEPIVTKDHYVFISTYSSSVHAGIHMLLFHESQGELTRVCGVAGIENPNRGFEPLEGNQSSTDKRKLDIEEASRFPCSYPATFPVSEFSINFSAAS